MADTLSEQQRAFLEANHAGDGDGGRPRPAPRRAGAVRPGRRPAVELWHGPPDADQVPGGAAVRQPHRARQGLLGGVADRQRAGRDSASAGSRTTCACTGRPPAATPTTWRSTGRPWSPSAASSMSSPPSGSTCPHAERSRPCPASGSRSSPGRPAGRGGQRPPAGRRRLPRDRRCPPQRPPPGPGRGGRRHHFGPRRHRPGLAEVFAAAVRDRHGHADLLVNNAGTGPGLDPIADGRDADWQVTLDTNVVGLLRVTRTFLPRCAPPPTPTSSTSAPSLASRSTRRRRLHRLQARRPGRHRHPPPGAERRAHPHHRDRPRHGRDRVLGHPLPRRPGPG